MYISGEVIKYVNIVKAVIMWEHNHCNILQPGIRTQPSKHPLINMEVNAWDAFE